MRNLCNQVGGGEVYDSSRGELHYADLYLNKSDLCDRFKLLPTFLLSKLHTQ